MDTHSGIIDLQDVILSSSVGIETAGSMRCCDGLSDKLIHLSDMPFFERPELILLLLERSREGSGPLGTSDRKEQM